MPASDGGAAHSRIRNSFGLLVFNSCPVVPYRRRYIETIKGNLLYASLGCREDGLRVQTGSATDSPFTLSRGSVSANEASVSKRRDTVPISSPSELSTLPVVR